MEPNLSGALEFIKDRLYYHNFRGAPQDTSKFHFFSTDDELFYEPFYADFGPLNLGATYRFCQILNTKLNDPELSKKCIVYYSSLDPQKRSNSVTVIGVYAVYYLRFTPDEACKLVSSIYPPLLPFRDASYGGCTYGLTAADVIRGMYKALIHQFVDFVTFDLEEYQHYEKVENGDLNEILPGKFIAFSGPSATRLEIGDGLYTLAPEDYHSIFRKKGITAIVRLNKKVYDRRQFTCAGFKHYDMYFMDGGTPTEAILRRFMEVAETETGGLAVHCKAGLGRTGTLIGCYIMKHYRFQAAELIGYLRVCRPGTIIGPQQYYLKEMEQRMWRLGEACRKKKFVSSLDMALLGIEPAVVANANASSAPDEDEPDGLSGSLRSLALTADSKSRVKEGAASPIKSSRPAQPLPKASAGPFDQKPKAAAAAPLKKTNVASSVLPAQYAAPTKAAPATYYDTASDAGRKHTHNAETLSSFSTIAHEIPAASLGDFPCRPRYTRQADL